ncbi:hypothetical protein [Streptomyces sp. RKCA744]|uniref:hypothetical protein n=1 Tax=Streptomyces sp. RKCA744 TaxID=2959340 RepID=UPI0020A00B54|nr:hypothetical protein [Streptomyces sp. RKCA744]MCO8301418.1 hypothetical protein [Streptomyces sp. RKCA744]
MLGGEEGPVAAVRLAPLVEGAGDVDPVSGLAFGGGQGGGIDAAGVFDGLACVAEQVADRDLVEEYLAGAEDGAAEQGVLSELPGGGFCLGDEGVGGVPVALFCRGVGGGGVQVALPESRSITSVVRSAVSCWAAVTATSVARA